MVKILTVTYSESVYELFVPNLAVFVDVKLVIDSSEFLSGQENTKLREELLELKLVQESSSVSIEVLHCNGIEKLVSLWFKDLH